MDKLNVDEKEFSERDLEIFEKLEKLKSLPFEKSIKAAKMGSLPVMKLYVKQYLNDFDKNKIDDVYLGMLLFEAASNNNIEIIKFLLPMSDDEYVIERTLKGAAVSGNINLFKLLAEPDNLTKESIYWVLASDKPGAEDIVDYIVWKFPDDKEYFQTAISEIETNTKAKKHLQNLLN